jgi:hypothetical protein
MMNYRYKQIDNRETTEVYSGKAWQAVPSVER